MPPKPKVPPYPKAEKAFENKKVDLKTSMARRLRKK